MAYISEKAKVNMKALFAQARINSAGNTDEQALQVASLYPEWADIPDGEELTAGQRIRHNGELYKVNDGQTHKKQADWTPDASPSLFSKVLTSEDPDEILPWEQPDSTNGYEKGHKVTHIGFVWVSNFDGLNVWEPGAIGTENLWLKVEE